MNTERKKLNNLIEVTNEPTFKPTLIDNLQIKLLKKDERGRMYILRNPNNSKYIKMHESVLEILKIFNGEKSIKEISQAIEDSKLPVNANELVKLLAGEGFIKNINPSKRKERGDIFSFRIKLFTITERRMAFLERLFSFVKRRDFKVIYAVFCVIGLSLFVYNFPRIFLITVILMSPETSLLPLFFSFISAYLVEFAHEFAHAISYHHYGGKSSEIGIEFHFFIPFFYTSTPDATWMEIREQIVIFLVGPMTSLFFAEIFTLLFIFEPTLQYLWAVHSFFWHLSALITLSPIIRTDGYFVVQAVTKFPNLLEHGADTLTKAFQILIRKISLKEFKEHMAQYSAYERKILKIYVPLFPVVTSLFVFVFVFAGLQFGMVEMLNMTPQILSGTAQGVKPYVLWVIYVSSIVFSLLGIIGTFINTLRGFRER